MAVIDQCCYGRLQDAISKGATIVDLVANQNAEASRRIMPPRIVRNPTDDMELMQREIVGPILLIKTHSSKDEVVRYINDRPRPLAFYAYTHDRDLAHWYIFNTMSGGLTVNDSPLYVSIHSLPFGGIGNSGMGQYHGYEGFMTFSKMRPVLYEVPIRALNMMLPPYGPRVEKILNLMIRMRS